MTKPMVIAFGGNAITKVGQQGSFPEQIENIRDTCKYLVRLCKQGCCLVITHGNGPQVGNVLIQNKLGSAAVPAMPMDVCVSFTQGSIGYALQQEMTNAMLAEGIKTPVATVITRVIVNKDDQAFANPTKPVGPFLDEKEAFQMEKDGYTVCEDSGRGFRRVVPSPPPIGIIEKDTISALVKAGIVVIAAGGGGIPVYQNASEYRGLEAVIDKDLAGQQLALDVGADTYVMLTGVRKVAINFGKPEQKELDVLTVEEGRRYQQEGHFPPGSMGPKIEAALSFVERGGKKAIIAALEDVEMAMEGKAGTLITR